MFVSLDGVRATGHYVKTRYASEGNGSLTGRTGVAILERQRQNRGGTSTSRSKECDSTFACGHVERVHRLMVNGMGIEEMVLEESKEVLIKCSKCYASGAQTAMSLTMARYC